MQELNLINQNKLLKDQLNQLKYYLSGSGALAVDVPLVGTGENIHCSKEDIHHIAANKIVSNAVSIDIGCGLRPQRLTKSLNNILVEPYQEYVDRLRGAYPESIIINTDGINALVNFFENSVDVVYLLDVIEHLEKKDGERLINEAYRVARKQVVIFTPLGFMPQEHEDLDSNLWNGASFDHHQDHLSGWFPSEFNNAIIIECANYHSNKYGAFYAILYKSSFNQNAIKKRAYLIGSKPDVDFENLSTDFYIADAKYCHFSWEISRVPDCNVVYLPFDFVIANYNKSIEFLQKNIVNFSVAFEAVQFLNERGYEFIPDNERSSKVLNVLKREL